MGGMNKQTSEIIQIAAKDVWLAYLDDDINHQEIGSADREFAELFKTFLTAGDADDLALEACVRCFDELDRKPTLTYEPMVTLLHLACIIPYHNCRQNMLLRLVKRLTEHPDAEERGYEENLSEFLHHGWNSHYPTRAKSPKLLWKRCEEWVNFSVFKSRTLAAGIYAKDGDDFKGPCCDIPTGLVLDDSPRKIADDDTDAQLLRDCKVMVSAQYILIAGGCMQSKIEADPYEGWDGESWMTWSTRFLEAAAWDNLQDTTRMVAKDARNKMIQLWPDLFVDKRTVIALQPQDGFVKAEQSA